MRLSFVFASLALLTATSASALDVTEAVAARQTQFKTLAGTFGQLAGMARGKVAYDAEAAQAAADQIVMLSQNDQVTLFPEGSDEMMVDGTRAMPAIWDNFDDFQAKWADLGAAALNLQAAAATGQDGLGTAVGQLGGTCGACHRSYRAPE